jgi:hypothetical protein
MMPHATTETTAGVQREIGPREPGTRYLFGYSGETYEVVHVEISGDSWLMTVERVRDGHVITHSTPWDPAGDRRYDPVWPTRDDYEPQP